MINRRRFISITAGAGLSALCGPAAASPSSPPLYRWRGIALGAAASIAIAHEDAPRLVALAQAEIARLEAIFSLYRTDSALSRLNAHGRLTAPPFELIELLSICESLHGMTEGAFDPTVQPLWALYAQSFSAGSQPTKSEIAETLRKTGWRHVRVSAREVAFAADGAALTLNGIAQGYISDKVAALLRRQGVTDTLVNMGEIVAMGRQPDGRPWRVGIANPSDPAQARKHHRLENRAIATSAPLGTVFDHAGSVGHILDPRTGYPGAKWRQVSVLAPQAARADGLSTAFCLMDEREIRQASAGLQVDLLP